MTPEQSELPTSILIISIVFLGSLLIGIFGAWAWTLTNKGKEKNITSNILNKKRENGIHKTHGKF